MDAIDKQILNILQEDDRTPYAKISERLGIGISTVHFRIKRLMARGIIKGFSVTVDPGVVGFSSQAWIGLSVDPLKMQDVAKQLTQYDEVQLVATSTGDHDMVVQVMAKDEKDLWRFIIEKIKPMDGIEKHFHVSSFLDIYKQTHAIKL